MELKELKDKLAIYSVPENSYCLTGGLPNEAYCIKHEVDSWQVYYSERGRRSELQTFRNEQAACEYFLAWVIRSTTNTAADQT